MKPFILLLKIQLLGLFGINKTLHADPAKAKRTLALAALVVAAVVLFASAYSAGVAQGLVQIGLAEAVPLVAVLVGAIAGAVAAFLKTNGVLFGFKDYDLVMSLPVPTSSVVLSRIASLYAMSLLFGVLVMVPAFAVYASAAGVSAVGVACMALSIVLAPLLPLAAAVVLAVLIAAVSSRFKHANVAVIVLTLAATLAAVFGSFALSGQSDDLAALSALGAQLTGQLAAIFPPAAWATAGIVQGDLVQFAAFAAVNIAAAAAVFALVVRLFVPVNSLLMSSRPRGTFSFDGDKGAGAGCSRRGGGGLCHGDAVARFAAARVRAVRRRAASVGARVLLRYLVHDGRVGFARGLGALAHADGSRVAGDGAGSEGGRQLGHRRAVPRGVGRAHGGVAAAGRPVCRSAVRGAACGQHAGGMSGTGA